MMGNMGNMMKKVQEMQSKMQEVQKELESKTVEANAGGGMVSIVMNGKQQVQSINIDPSLLNADEKEVLEDLIKAALNQAKEKVDEMSAEEMKKVTGGLALPPGMKLPF
ncbi:MAG: YbaB/EbfC family nucleoid-associated protein [Proteobacteria bacterium]|nr:YbaB/EbfC family nucleoid-associated protein [Pseudomonadota bacterium]